MFANAAMGGGPVPVPDMADGSGAAPTSPTTTVRKYFPETWIWDCFDSGCVLNVKVQHRT